jgi:hypothetical protein
MNQADIKTYRSTNLLCCEIHTNVGMVLPFFCLESILKREFIWLTVLANISESVVLTHLKRVKEDAEVLVALVVAKIIWHPANIFYDGLTNLYQIKLLTIF